MKAIKDLPIKSKRPSLGLLGIVRLICLASTIVIFVPMQLVLLQISPKNWWRIPKAWHQVICWLLGMKITVVGGHNQKKGESALYVSNHISWKDIFILGSLLDKASFVAKAEVKTWALFGFLSKFQKTVFVNRARRHDSAKQRDEMAARVTSGDSLILFPEGTSTLGIKVHPFKSALFSVAEIVADVSDGHLTIQPVTISYTAINGMPVSRARKSQIGWAGDVELLPHIIMALSRVSTNVFVEMHETVSLDELPDSETGRKALAKLCENIISDGLERANRGEHSYGPRR